MTETTLSGLPARYVVIERLGKGGGGEVWAVRDRVDGRQYALKTLSQNATEREGLALVREASALSGLEGLGVPRVVRFGTLKGRRAPYLVRELVSGKSLADRLEKGIEPMAALEAVASAADQLTMLHRASLLHGDVKPANIIVGDDGSATLVDLGLAAPFRERGEKAEGLSPGYGAPELYMGEALTVRAEVYSLGASLRDVVELAGETLPAALRAQLFEVVERAVIDEPLARFPSVDEFATALRHAAGLPASRALGTADAAWPIVAIDATVARLLAAVSALSPGGVLDLRGRAGSGRTAVMRRLAWSLGIEGRPMAWIEAAKGNIAEAVSVELEVLREHPSAIVLVDDLERLGKAETERLQAAKASGARLVVSANGHHAERVLGAVDVFAVPPLERQVAASLVRRANPSLNESVIAYLVGKAEGRPGRLRALVRRLEGQAVVSAADVDRLVSGKGPTVSEENLQAAAAHLLDQGRLSEAATLVAKLEGDRSEGARVLRARLLLGKGEADAALRELEGATADGPVQKKTLVLYRARAHLRKGAYAEAIALSDDGLAIKIAGDDERHGRALSADLLACKGVAESYLGEHARALSTLERAVSEAKKGGERRVEALSLASLAMALQRGDRLPEARRAYEESLEAAEDAGDAGSMATIRLNLAALSTSGQGEIAEALSHLEAAVDLGKKAGRASTVQQALLNLANLDLYLGRLERASSEIDTLSAQRDDLSGGQKAQLLGLEAELSSRGGSPGKASELYERCAAAYEALGRNVDAAEARIEAVLLAARSDARDPSLLASQLEQASSLLSGTRAHRAALCLARGVVAMLSRDEPRSRVALEEALSAAREAGQKEWIWRVLEARSRLELEGGRNMASKRDAEEALSVLEDIAARLPRDLREVYWNDPRRRALRTLSTHDQRTLGERLASLELAPTVEGRGPTRFLEEDRLAKIFEINRELSQVHDLKTVLDRVVTHASALLQAERGYVLLVGDDGSLEVHASRELRKDETHQRFSKSIAERTVASGEPIVSMSARDDARMAGYESVHHLNLQSVACVPIRSPRGGCIGALYLETRTRSGALFEREIRTLSAFADQAAIAIESARLLEENARRAEALEKANGELEAARARLEELLAEKRAQLQSTRKDLKDTRAVLRSHFGYQGLVGTSAAMRRVYALVERVKETDVPVLLTGESGTGKEMVARAIHDAGARGKRPFTGVNCGAIPENLLESELFGHVRGAFTGAERDRRGLFRESEGGTILLDEIGEMPMKMQAGLLRVLQEKVVRPVGGTREEPIDVRVIAATHRDLLTMVQAGSFREDLYYRLRVVEVPVPPLRERQEDIPLLIDHFLQIFATRYRRDKGSVSREALRALMAYPWPGNVRQLQNVLLNAWVLSETPELPLDAFDLPGQSRMPSGTMRPPSAELPTMPRARVVERPLTMPPADDPVATQRAGGPGSSGPESLADHRAAEKERILEALRTNNWNRVKAAQALAIPRRTFYRRLKEYGIQ